MPFTRLLIFISDIRVRWNLDGDLPLYTPRFNIAPEQISPTIPVVVRHNDGNECKDGTPVESFTIMTTEPNQLVRPIHNRMPVILRREDEEQWLDASRTTFVKAKSLLKPYSEELMDAHDISTIVKSAKYDGPECIQPVSDEEIRRAGQLSLL